MSAHNHSDVRTAIRRAAEKFAHDVSDATEAALEDAAIAVKHSAHDLGERAAAKTRVATRTVRKGMRESPATWISVSVGAGLILGALLARRPAR